MFVLFDTSTIPTPIGASFFIKTKHLTICCVHVLYTESVSDSFFYIYWLSLLVLFATLKWKVWTHNYRLPVNSSIYFLISDRHTMAIMESTGLKYSMNSFIYLISINGKKEKNTNKGVVRIFYIVNITIPKPAPRFFF